MSIVFAEMWESPNIANLKPELAWVDMETTGLQDDPNAIPLEVGVVITDAEGEQLASCRSLLLPKNWETSLDHAPKVVKDMHKESGLANDLRQAQNSYAGTVDQWVVLSYGTVDFWLADFLYKYGGPAQKLPMAGSTINFDRHFMTWLPTAAQWFHYRNLDVSSIMVACRLLNPDLDAQVPEIPADVRQHRVIEDINASIKRYQFYKDNFLFTV